MRKIDWEKVLVWLFVMLMAVLLIVVIIAQIRADINKDELNDFILLLHTRK